MSVVTPTGTPTTHATDTTSVTADCKELDTQDHPTPPETLTQEIALQFVEEYINVTAWNTGIEGSDWKYQRVSTTAKGYIVNSTNNPSLVV